MTNTQKKYHYLYPPFDYEKRNFRGFSYSNKYIIGLIDSDGSYTIVPTDRKKGCKVGMSCRISVIQKAESRDVVDILHKQLGFRTARVVETSERNRRSGKTKEKVVLNISLGVNPQGPKILDILRKNKPLVPGKRRDYLIMLKCFEYYQDQKYLLLELKPLAKTDPASAERISAVIVLSLMYRMTHEVYGSPSQKRDKPLSDYISQTKATPEEILAAQVHITTYMNKVENEVDALTKYLMSDKARIPANYIAGYHLGDGCVTASAPETAAHTPAWTATESNYSDAILYGMRTTLKRIRDFEIPDLKTAPFGTVTRVSRGANRLKIQGYSVCSLTIVPILNKRFMPYHRQRSYNIYRRFLELRPLYQLIAEGRGRILNKVTRKKEPITNDQKTRFLQSILNQSSRIKVIINQLEPLEFNRV